MVRQKTPTGRKSPVLFARVRGSTTVTYPYIVTIMGRVAGEDSHAARAAVLKQVRDLAEEGKIAGAATIRVSYQRTGKVKEEGPVDAS